MMRTIQLVIAGFAFALGFTLPAYGGIISHWQFEEGVAGAFATGSSSILDSSANSLHMSPFGTSQYVSVTNPGSTVGMEYFGAGYAFRADSSQYNVQNLTLEAFVRYDGGSSLRQIFFRGNSVGGRDPFYLAVLNGHLAFNVSDGITADVRIDSPGLLPVGQFVHVAGTLDHTTDTMKIFVAGVEVGSRSAGGLRPTTLLSGSQVSIGALYDGFSRGQYFDGVIDEVRISNLALSPSQFLGADNGTVPEPATLALFCTGLLMVFRLGRRKVHS